ncbi:putative membrane protein YphA (DoxX/SURF4 family) [Kordia periserrulae]|uniref:Putative membrane protein YphA (DoxX/SURF4 family) n=1 Tax=Kordia periserrulae TaxID=701523 RepID=A0A2T6BTM6_9FLAO|nr:BT_3928 family protein [Kordia periserrulae]PTX59432.1 putative membrane protein YphA (DoxX/SURF4 family) [Kordia periserrulae]
MEKSGTEQTSNKPTIWQQIVEKKVAFFNTIYGKILTIICQIFVGGLFIFSGFIKLNDPVGFSFKLTDYFAEDVLNLPSLVPYALWLAVFLVILEVILGVMILLSLFKKPVLWSLLGLIVFFTFLTFYSAYFNKVTDCGCFGDFWKLTPWESFTKDIILLVAILILFIGMKHIKPIFSKKINIGIAVVSLIACIFFGRHVLNHLPVFDFRPYKIGANIPDGMIVPPDAPKPIIEYTWVFDVNGEDVEVVTTDVSQPQVEGGVYKDLKSEIIDEGYEPPIHDFIIESPEEGDVTDRMLEEEKIIMVIMYRLEKAEEAGLFKVKEFTDKALAAGYKVIGLSASDAQELQDLADLMQFNFNFYLTDPITLKTIVRSNPGIIKVEKGTITDKKHYNDFDTIKL